MIDARQIFGNREEAGRKLAGRLERYGDEDPVVLALPRGGVPVGYEISRTLDAPLDVILARKLGAPGQPELAIGAVAPGGVRTINERLVRWLEIPEEWIDSTASREFEEIERRTDLFRKGRPEPDLSDRTVILVDDGIATGMTARAAIRSVRERGARRVVLAVPVCSAETARELASEVDEIVCLKTPEDLLAIGYWYEDFRQVGYDEVVELLQSAEAKDKETGKP